MSLMGLLQISQQKVWCSRAWRKSFPEWFGISAHGESRFPNGLVFPRMAKVISWIVWCFRAWQKSFPEWFEFFAVRGNICEKLGCVLQFVSDSLYFLLYNGIHLFGRRLFVAWIVPNDEPWGDRKDEERDREIIIEYSIVVFEKIENAM